MTKIFVDEMIRNMKRADMVTKVAPWMFEGMGDKKMNVRYVGLKLQDDWLDIFSPNDNILLKFIYDRSAAYIETYIANKPPFQKMMTLHFTEQDKWEPLLGNLKRRLKKDKVDFQNHTDQIGNIYTRVKPFLK